MYTEPHSSVSQTASVCVSGDEVAADSNVFLTPFIGEGGLVTPLSHCSQGLVTVLSHCPDLEHEVEGGGGVTPPVTIHTFEWSPSSGVQSVRLDRRASEK